MNSSKIKVNSEANNFGLRLRALLERRRIEPIEFARLYQISRTQVFNWLKRDTPPLPKHWPRLTAFFGVSEKYLISGEPSSSLKADGTAVDPGLPADMIRAAIRAQVDRAIGAAGDDLSRLGWIAEQTKSHLSPPIHWTTPNDIIAMAEADAARRLAGFNAADHPVVRAAEAQGRRDAQRKLAALESKTKPRTAARAQTV